MMKLVLSPEELVERLRERLTEIIDMQQNCHLKYLSRLETVCEEYDADGAIWDAVERVGNTVNHMGGPLADAQKLAAALHRWIVDNTEEEN